MNDYIESTRVHIQPRAPPTQTHVRTHTPTCTNVRVTRHWSFILPGIQPNTHINSSSTRLLAAMVISMHRQASTPIPPSVTCSPPLPLTLSFPVLCATVWWTGYGNFHDSGSWILIANPNPHFIRSNKTGSVPKALYLLILCIGQNKECNTLFIATCMLRPSMTDIERKPNPYSGHLGMPQYCCYTYSYMCIYIYIIV